MCGRFVQKTPLGEIRVLFETANGVPNAPPTYNAAPTDRLAVVRFDPATHARSLDLLRWGLVPYWAKDTTIGVRCINAMAETVATKPAFREAFLRRRCLVPADRFYEWKRVAAVKQPYAIGLADGTPMAFAGLWERWKDAKAGGEPLYSFTIITGPPNELCAAIHHRMPVILRREDWPRWLGETPADAESLLALLRPYPADRMRADRVASRVGNVRNNDPDLLEPLAPTSS